MFSKYFSLEEAVGMLPSVMEALEEARREMDELRDGLTLYRRIILTKQEEGLESTDAEVATLQNKFEAFEAAFNRWVACFAEKGIVLRDLDTGLMDFPYRSNSRQEDYFLCWRLPEEGIFYFHSISEGFAGRHPISLLPD